MTTPLWPVSSSSEPAPASDAPTPEAPDGAAPEREVAQGRARLLVAYLGTEFHGFALQRGLRTVAGELGGALERVLGEPVTLTCAGRTDAGAHAWGQVVSLAVPAGADLERAQRSVNKMLSPSVVVREAAWAPAGFDARRSAQSRVYRYSVECARWPSPFAAQTSWHVGLPLDVRSMQAAADALLGEHDFSSFCHAVKGRPGPVVRKVLRADWAWDAGGLLIFEIEAVSFCHQMVRSLVGMLVEVGQGRRHAGEVLDVLRARDRAAAGPVAPPHGLCLWGVKYLPGAF
ncbi:MAG TPA: tRNA pseudouridine(38-40) synthase TruA [Acidimicrobiales bacterium]|nr:tRNA pseudouridine(38-40) synthase TruA [Acidimicrobiales bacterium]